MYQVTRLDNSLTVATAEMPQMASVSVGLWIGVGSRCEPESMNGVCHFIEHLLFKGTRRRSAREISQAVEGLGGYINAFTSEEATCFHARAEHRNLDALLDVLCDMLLHSRFDPLDVAKERDVIKEEIAMYYDEPQHHVQELLNTTLWPRQPLGRPITGTPESLDRLDRESLVRYLRTHYVTGATVIVASGRVSHRRLLRAIQPFARHFLPGTRPGFQRAQDEQNQPRVALFTKKTEQTQIALGIRTCSRHAPSRFAMRLLNTLLGENMSSRLFQIIREEHGLAYSIYSTPSFFSDTGDLVVSSGLDTQNLPRVLRFILRELRRLSYRPPSRSELRRARDYVIGQMELGRENTETQMNWVGDHLLGYGKIIRPETLEKRLLEVKPSDIRDVAAQFFRPERLNLALVSPLTTTRSIEKTLRWAFH